MSFNGKITERIREELRNRRACKGYTYQQMADEIGISWLTLRNWEHGITLHCSIKTRGKLEAYLNTPSTSEIQKHPNNTNHLIRKTERLIEICEHYPEARDSLLDSLNNTVQETLATYSINN